ncbi:MAG: hypothetical protein ABOJ95_000176 [Wolbachia endosymbiont of Armadillidium vulgare]|uniref:hypothetical protein n=1 Tax=Wolbachia endosymbiont of Armadillidium vulgare TaxID=77039 RepID=UPI000919E7BF|nr:hypothetical protein [Wolbachia endosymbiont of Armadillidium vulgare]OJH31297.1 hypothetical protein Wxf_00683 [Wolbachia endosymbiont of Armadillidium vulgare]OJH32392.1 hypothetical protein Wxf_01825 [Wolbachia endosymbiont of Armadillidium vulgare]
MLRKVTNVVKLVGWTTQGTTQVKVLSPEILDVIEVDTFHIVEDYSAPICLDHFFQSDPIFKMNMLINTSTHI